MILCVSEQTLYRWEKKHARLGVAELRRLKQVEEENRKLKRLVADLSLDKKMCSGRAVKKTDRSVLQRANARDIDQLWRKRATGLRGIACGMKLDEWAALRVRLRDLATSRKPLCHESWQQKRDQD